MLLTNVSPALPELSGESLLPNANAIRRAIAAAKQPGKLPDVLAQDETNKLLGRVPRVPRLA